MNISITLPNDAIPAWQARVDLYNAGSGKPPLDIAGFIQMERDEQTVVLVAAKADADKTALGDNAALVAIGMQVAAAPADKQAAAIAAAQAVLNS